MDAHSNELELFRDNVVRFLKAHVEPHYEKWEKDGITPRSLWNQMGEAGLLCVDAPAEYGGMGAPFEFACVVLDEILTSVFAVVRHSTQLLSNV